VGTICDERDGKYGDYFCREAPLTQLQRPFGIAFTTKVRAMVDCTQCSRYSVPRALLEPHATYLVSNAPAPIESQVLAIHDLGQPREHWANCNSRNTQLLCRIFTLPPKRLVDGGVGLDRRPAGDWYVACFLTMIFVLVLSICFLRGIKLSGYSSPFGVSFDTFDLPCSFPEQHNFLRVTPLPWSSFRSSSFLTNRNSSLSCIRNVHPSATFVVT
jgi:hypothetical protein